MQKDLYNRLLEFELDNDIFDTSEYDRTIEHVKEELKTPKDIKQYINYYNLVLVAEEGSNDKCTNYLSCFSLFLILSCFSLSDNKLLNSSIKPSNF